MAVGARSVRDAKFILSFVVIFTFGRWQSVHVECFVPPLHRVETLSASKVVGLIGRTRSCSTWTLMSFDDEGNVEVDKNYASNSVDGVENGEINGSNEKVNGEVVDDKVNGDNRAFKGFGPAPSYRSQVRKNRVGRLSDTLSDELEGEVTGDDIELDNWKALMAVNTNAPVNRPGKETRMEEGMEEGMELLYKELHDMSPYDNEQVNMYWDDIMPTVSYLGTERVAKIKSSLRVAYRAHRSQKRKSGEPFIIHPVEVCLLLSGLKMDAETLMAALLHDTVEDTDLTFRQIEAMFGRVVRSIVEGETKVSKLPKLAFTDYADEQAENLRQMFVAMTDDYRIIVVKLADRLHNMRTLRYMKPAKQKKISRETLDIFAPLAHRMGIWQFKSELEDTAFMYLYPKEYKRLNRGLRHQQTQLRQTLEKCQSIMRKTLDEDPTIKEQAASVRVQGRTKELYSLWVKMNSKENDGKGENHNESKDLNHIDDVAAVRVIIDPESTSKFDSSEADNGVWLCYHVLGLVQHLPGFRPLPTRVKDYISFPKPNGYQSLHTALMLNGHIVEVQIRTVAMHQVEEYGMASLWAYHNSDKSNKGGGEFSNELYNTPWLSSIKEWQDDVVSSRDFVDCVRRELLGKRVFVFLRNGKILNLARGASVVDAAFQINTEVGLKMHGVLINGKPVPLSYELQNGDVVNILTGEGKPATDWMRYAKSRSTRSKLRTYFRSKQRESFQRAGEILILDFLSKHHDLIATSPLLRSNGGDFYEVPKVVDDISDYLPGDTPFLDVDDMLIAIGESHSRDYLRGIVSKLFDIPVAMLIDADENRRVVLSRGVFSAVKAGRKKATDTATAVGDDGVDGVAGAVNGVSGTDVLPNDYQPRLSREEILVPKEPIEMADPEHLCEKCLPIIGDDIIGTRPPHLTDAVTTVHRRGCECAQRALYRTRSLSLGQANRNGYSPENGKGKNGKNGRIKTSNGVRNGHSIVRNGKNGDVKERSAMRIRSRKRFLKKNSVAADDSEEIAVDVQWPDSFPLDGEKISFLTEVVVVASDRKLLLADCSEVVSQMSEIVKTVSSTSDEHAKLEFLIRVHDLDQLQTLMDTLGNILSVMSVERRFGSKL